MFTADWCQPSEGMKNSFNRLAIEYAGRVQFFFVDVDDEPEWTSSWSVPVLPTTYFIYESDIASDNYRWMAQKSVLPISFLRDKINWLLSNWTLKNLPMPIKYKDRDENTDIYNIISAALNGDVESQNALGEFYNSWKDSVMWNYMAAQNGHPDAMCRLAMYYFQFKDSEQKSVELMINAAEKGSMDAINYLIDAYHDGCCGVQKNSERESYYRSLRATFEKY